MQLKQNTVFDSLKLASRLASTFVVPDTYTTDAKTQTQQSPVFPEQPLARAGNYLGRALRVSGLAGAVAILVFHVNGILSTSPAVSAILALAFSLLALSGLPPLQGVRLRNALRDDCYALSPLARELAQVAFNLLVPLGLIIEPMQRHTSLKGSLMMAVPQLLMALACIVKAVSLWPREASRR